MILEVPQEFKVNYQGIEEPFKTVGFNTSYGSGFAYKGTDKDGNLEFYGLSDRGPNGDIPTYMENGKKLPGKFFMAPDFVPQIGVIKVIDGKAIVTEVIKLKDQNGNFVSGRPIPQGGIGSTGEIALDLNMNKLALDINGLDPEGIVVDKDGNLWIDDEYGPFLMKVDKDGKILEKYGPGEGLPEELKFRVPNRGFEGVAIDSNGQIYAAIQSVLNIDGKTKDKGLFTRIIKMDPKTKKVKTFAYPVNTTYKKTGDAKIGDIFSIALDKLLVIEQGKNKDGVMTNFIYKIDLTKATDITGRTELEAITDRNELNITMATKELVVDLREHGWTTEKAEGMTVLPDGKTIIVVNDNDFGVDIYPNPSKITYNADKKEFSKDGKLMNIKNMSIVENEPLERNTELWFFTLDKKIVY